MENKYNKRFFFWLVIFGTILICMSLITIFNGCSSAEQLNKEVKEYYDFETIKFNIDSLIDAMVKDFELEYNYKIDIDYDSINNDAGYYIDSVYVYLSDTNDTLENDNTLLPFISIDSTADNYDDENLSPLSTIIIIVSFLIILYLFNKQRKTNS